MASSIRIVRRITILSIVPPRLGWRRSLLLNRLALSRAIHSGDSRELHFKRLLIAVAKVSRSRLLASRFFKAHASEDQVEDIRVAALLCSSASAEAVCFSRCTSAMTNFANRLLLLLCFALLCSAHIVNSQPFFKTSSTCCHCLQKNSRTNVCLSRRYSVGKGCKLRVCSNESERKYEANH